METILEKYNKIRHLLKVGDFVVFFGTGIIAEIIKASDCSKASHVGTLDKLRTRFIIIDSNAPGTHPEWMSGRIKKYNPQSNFCVIRPLISEEEMNHIMNFFIEQKNDSNSKYDFKNGIKEMINRITNRIIGKRYFKTRFRDGYDICSMSGKERAISCNIFNEYFYEKGLHQKDVIIFPEDYLRYRNEKTTDLLFIE